MNRKRDPRILSRLLLVCLMGVLVFGLATADSLAEIVSLVGLFFCASWLHVLCYGSMCNELASETERKHETQVLLDTYFQNCPMGFGLVDRDFRYLRVNEALARTHNHRIEDTIGRTIAEIVPEVWEKLGSDFQAALNDGQFVKREIELEHLATGPGRWVCGVFPVRDVSRRIVGVGIFASDVTARYKMEAQMREWNERFTLAEEAANVGTWEWKTSTKGILTSLRCATMLGYDPEELTGDASWFALVHPDDTKLVTELWENAIRGNSDGFQAEYRLQHKQGGYRWTLVRAKVERCAKEGVRIVGASIDITDKKEAEAHAVRTSKMVDAILDNCPWGIALLDTQMRYQHINRALEDLNRIPIKDTIGKRLEDILPHDIWLKVQAMYQRVAETRMPQSAEHDDRSTPGGSGRHWLATYFPIPGVADDLVGYGAIVADITDTKLKEQRLLELTQELKKSNTELERFAYVASHDLKEPLRMISTYLGLLSRESADRMSAKETTYLGYALDGSKRLNALIDSLLKFSRIGQDRSEYKQVPLEELAKEAVETLRPTISESGAQVTIGNLPEVIGDRVQLSQVFQNLLSNALKFRRKDVSPNIHISFSRGAKESIISVTDNGVGIQAADQAKIFEIFRRLHRRTEYPGEGIGLAACKRIVEAHGGRIWVTSEEGNGSSFHFAVPDRSGMQAAKSLDGMLYRKESEPCNQLAK